MKRCLFAFLLSTLSVIAISAQSAGLPAPGVTQDWNAPPIYPIQKSVGDEVAQHRQERLQNEYHAGKYESAYQPYMDKDIGHLPVPEKLPQTPKLLTLRDAIALALRNAPAVKVSELQRILDKFSLELVIQSYRVQWQPLTFSSTLQNGADPQWNTSEGIALNQTLTGTTFSLAHTNNLLGGMGSNVLTLTQPLLQNFGEAYNRIPYDNGIDNEKIARLNFKNSVIDAVVGVITSYNALVQSYDTLDENKRSEKAQEKEVQVSKLEVKVGKLAPNDLLQQETQLASFRLGVVQQQYALLNAYQAFLISLGLKPSTELTIDRKITIGQVKVPSLKQCIQIALRNNIAYQSALLSLNITKRSLITAENARKWTLNATSAVTLGSKRTGVGSPIMSIGTNPTLGLSLSIPIDNISLKQGVVSAKVAIEDAKLNLEQQKETLVSNVMNQWYNGRNQYQQIQISKKQIAMQEEALKNEKIGFRYGKNDVFDVNNLESQLLSQRVSLISEEIGYLNAYTTLEQTLGLTLNRWGIKLRY